MATATRRSGVFRGLIAMGVLAGIAMTTSPTQADSGVAPFLPEPACLAGAGLGPEDRDRNTILSSDELEQRGGVG